MGDVEYICGLPVNNLSYSEIEQDLGNCFENNKKMVITSVNPQISLQALKNEEVKSYIDSATHRIADGVGVVAMSRLFKGNIRERITGVDVMTLCLRYANKNKLSIFLYGARKKIVKKAAQNIRESYQNIEISGYIDGYSEKDGDTISELINKAKPDFVFVALGSPNQEVFLNRNKDRIEASVFLDVGGTFDVLSGEVKRAPDFFIKYNIEWLYRSFTMKRLDRLKQIPLYVIHSCRIYRRIKKENKKIISYPVKKCSGNKVIIKKDI